MYLRPFHSLWSMAMKHPPPQLQPPLPSSHLHQVQYAQVLVMHMQHQICSEPADRHTVLLSCCCVCIRYFSSTLSILILCDNHCAVVIAGGVKRSREGSAAPDATVEADASGSGSAPELKRIKIEEGSTMDTSTAVGSTAGAASTVDDAAASSPLPTEMGGWLYLGC